MGVCALCGNGTEFMAYTNDLCLYCGDMFQNPESGLALGKILAERLNRLRDAIDGVKDSIDKGVIDISGMGDPPNEVNSGSDASS